MIKFYKNEQILAQFVGILKKFCNESSAEELRAVCVECIETSQILRCKKYKKQVCDIWLILICLLQDFELPIRQSAAKSISFLFGSSSYLPNYCVKAVFDHLENEFMSKHLQS